VDDLISRQAAITAIQKAYADTEGGMDKLAVWKNVGLTNALHIMQDLPSAQPERDIPKKPIPTTDRAWGIPLRQAVCPNCNVYLGMIHFISENGKTKVTYCETCGQAIDWEGWDYDE